MLSRVSFDSALKISILSIGYIISIFLDMSMDMSVFMRFFHAAINFIGPASNLLTVSKKETGH
jgi:hypothetical protein